MEEVDLSEGGEGGDGKGRGSSEEGRKKVEDEKRALVWCINHGWCIYRLLYLGR